MKNKIKIIVLKLCNLFFPRLRGRAAILMYHSVENNNLFFTVTPEEFKKQLQYLRDRKFEVVSLKIIFEKLKNKNPIDNLVAVTFDDGYEDIYQNVFPLLKEYNVPATVFIVSGFIGEKADFLKEKKLKILSKEQISEMSSSGLVDIMPHTVTHPRLDQIAFEGAITEIEDSRKSVELISVKPAGIFAYPKGKLTDKIAEYLKEEGTWEGAVTANIGLVRSGDNTFRLNRIPVDSATSIGVFKSKLSQGIEIYEMVKNALK